MPLVSVTRLRIRSWRFLPSFIVLAMRSTEQVRRAPGFVGGWLGSERLRGFWTVTVWEDLAAMRAFRNAEPHVTAMRKLLRWCDEASYAHWEQQESAAPAAGVVYRRLAESGIASKVDHPTPRQQGGRTVGDTPPRPGRSLIPR